MQRRVRETLIEHPGFEPSLLIRQASTLSKTPSLLGSVRGNLLSPSEQKKDQEDQGGDEERRLPLRKPLHRNILDFPGSSEAASVDRNKSEAADQILNGFFGGMDISGVVNLAQESFNFRVVLKRSRSRSSSLGRGCGSVGSTVASDTRDPWFESQHRQYSISNVFLC